MKGKAAICISTPLIAGVNDDKEHFRSVVVFTRPHNNVIDYELIDYELLPYHPFGESKYRFLERVYELADFKSPRPESVARLQAIIDQAFGRSTRTNHG